MKKLLAVLTKFKGPLVVLAVSSVLGYTAYQLSLIPAVAPNHDTIEAEKKRVNASQIKFDLKTIEAITKQNTVSAPTTAPANVGKTDPFF